MNNNAKQRQSSFSIDPLFLQRWSPRAFNEDVIPEADLLTMIEAARWSPSSYNSQPWVFLYARRGSHYWDKFLNLLNEFNQSWAKRAGALVIIASNCLMIPPGTDKPVPAHSHTFDAGAAWMAFALQGTKLGWYVHGMAGFDRQRAQTELNLPGNYKVEVAIAIGRPDDKSVLPEQLQAIESPNDRNPLETIAFEGGFRF